MPYYRQATAAHADGIAALIEMAWGTTADAEWIRAVVRLPQQVVWLAVHVEPNLRERVLGFCAGFWTAACDGTRRWEMDLLAVHPDKRGQGIGRELVARCSLAGKRYQVAVQRALIAVGNAASERCFAASGFEPVEMCDLWVGAPPSVEPALLPSSAHLVSVDTLTYRGVWVEGATDAAAFRAAQQRALAEGRNTVGAVIPTGLPHDAEALGFSRIDTYQWWVMKHSSASS